MLSRAAIWEIRTSASIAYFSKQPEQTVDARLRQWVCFTAK